MSGPTLTDIPFGVFLDALVPHLEVKEIGSLTLVSKDLKGSCDDNLVWREMYLRTIRCGITDASVHLVPRSYVVPGSNRKLGPLSVNHIDTQTIVDPDGRLYRGISCIPTEVRLSVPTIPPDLVNFRHGYHPTGHKVRMERRAEYSEVIRRTWQAHNRELGLSTVNLCQCESHYQFDTLDIPSSCKNCKSYKTTVLSKMRTQAKKPIAPLNTKLRKKQRDIKSMETHLHCLRIEEAALKADHAKGSRLSDRLNTAVTSMKDAVTKRNQKVKDDNKRARLAKAEAKKKKKAEKAKGKKDKKETIVE